MVSLWDRVALEGGGLTWRAAGALFLTLPCPSRDELIEIDGESSRKQKVVLEFLPRNGQFLTSERMTTSD